MAKTKTNCLDCAMPGNTTQDNTTPRNTTQDNTTPGKPGLFYYFHLWASCLQNIVSEKIDFILISFENLCYYTLKFAYLLMIPMQLVISLINKNS